MIYKKKILVIGVNYEIVGMLLKKIILRHIYLF